MKLASTDRIVAVYVGGEHLIIAAGTSPTVNHHVELRQCRERLSPPMFEVVCWPGAVARATTEYVAYVRAALELEGHALIVVRDAHGEHEVKLRELHLFTRDGGTSVHRAKPSARGEVSTLVGASGPRLEALPLDLWGRLVRQTSSKMVFSPPSEEVDEGWEILHRPGLR